MGLVSTINLIPKEVRVIWDTGTSKTIVCKHLEEVFFRGANRILIGVGIERRDNL